VDTRTDVIPLREATKAWFLVSLQTFGGPAGQIAVMQHELVDKRRWIGQQRFLHALNFCMLLPGPEAQQLATYTGWLLNGRRGGLVAGGLFVLPGVVAMLALSGIYVAAGDTTVVTGIFAGLAPAVVAIVLQAVHRVGKRALTGPALVALATLSFVAIAFLAVPFPLVILLAGIAGWLLGRAGRIPPPRAHDEATDGPAPLISDDALHQEARSPARTARLAVVGVVLWLLPVGVAAMLLGRDSVLVDQGLFFSGTAVVTFGGAYAVLAYVAHQAVNVFGWLAPGEMVRGLALAETTPGPLIMVVQFVAFIGAYRDPGTLEPWVAAVLASALVVWVTFVPSFLLVLLGAPYVERLRHNRALSSALSGITAAVVGVIASLALFFAVHTLFDETRQLDRGPLHVLAPVWTSIDPWAVALTAVALVLVFVRGWSPLRTLGLLAVLGLAVQLAAG
jgi:chromate transporter